MFIFFLLPSIQQFFLYFNSITFFFNNSYLMRFWFHSRFTLFYTHALSTTILLEGEISLPDDLLLSDIDYGADILAILLDFSVVLFLIFFSLLFLRAYTLSIGLLKKFFLISNLYLLLWEFFFILLFWSFFDLVALFDDDAPNLFFNLLLLDDTTRRLFITFLILPVFVDVFLVFFHQFTIKFIMFNRLTAFELPIMLSILYFFSVIFLRSFDLFLIYVLLEAISFIFVVVIVLDYSKDSTEAAIKYFTVSAVSGGFYVFGTAWFYGLFGNTDFFTLLNYFYADDFIIFEDLSILTLPFILILVSFSFKLSVFPGHAWAPDVYSGSSYAVIYFISVFLKLIFIFIFIEILTLSFYFIYFWRIFLIFSSFGSAVVSFLGAYRQNNLKRWLAYSTINQMGFILLGLAAYDSFFGLRSVIFYIFSYLMSVTIFFSIVSCTFNKNSGELITLNDLVSFCRAHTFQALCITAILFSLSGLPPFIGFFGKYFILLALFDSSLSSFLFLFFLFNSFSAYYYIRFIQVIWTRSAFIVDPQSTWLTSLDLTTYIPSQQLHLKIYFFIVLPFFLSDIVELSVLLTHNSGCSWV